MLNDLETLNGRIAERIGKELVELIPDDQWKQMVDSEINKFKMETAPKLIHDMLVEEYTKTLREVVNELAATQEWDDLTQKYTNDKLLELIGASGGELMASVLAPSMQLVMQNLRQQLPY